MKEILFTLSILIIFTLQYNAQTMDRYPVPEKTEFMLFYIQRNHNSNTVIYDVNFDKNGEINKKKPIEVYWLRYDEKGQKRDLTQIEKKFAYGVKCNEAKNKEYTFLVNLVAYDKRQMILTQHKPFEASMYIKINGFLSELDHLYIYADNSKLWPDVIYIELYGVNINSGEKTYEKIKV